MVEGVLFEEDEDSRSGDKRRKSPTLDTTLIHDSPHTASNALKKLKKLKGTPVPSHGIGYAGDAREDVCVFHFWKHFTQLGLSDHRTAKGTGCAKAQGREDDLVAM